MSPRTRYLTTTLALVAVLLGYGAWQWRAERPGPPRPPRSAAPPPVRPPDPPTARDILERGSALSLSAEQTARLEALDRSWREESRPLEAELQAATAEFSRFMSDAKGQGRRASLQELQRRTAEVSDLGAALRERRRRHAEAAARVLSDGQRAGLTRTTSHVTSGGNR